ncbi:MAG TPA: polysaccharide deacetylase [Gammaproteobacteria bacterium]|nr:polysaccharide deacetylase [Gammaproteobacteria bacterium]
MLKSLLPLMALCLLLAGASIHGTAGAAEAAPATAVVFMYHRFGETAHPSTNIRLDQFEAQLDYLQRAGYQILPLEDIVAALAAGRPLPPRAVALTIDDAYLSVYREAYPRLRARGWPFTVFVATDPVDRHLRDFMSWEQMREMGRHGARFANHSRSHGHLIRRLPGESAAQWKHRVRDDIEYARRRLVVELGVDSRLFAYPYGEYDTALANLVRDLGYTAFGQQSGALGPDSDRRALPRFPMAEKFADLAPFRVKAAALPLPVRKVIPWDPVTREARPRLEIWLGESDARLERLACYASGQGALPVQWLAGPGLRFATRAREDLPPGRSRYNCTAPAGDSGRYYWFSHPWIRQETR